jgi:TPR repeat protein
MRLKLIAATAAVVLLQLLPGLARADIARECPKGQAWDASRGACRKPVNKKFKKLKEYQKALDDVESRGDSPDPARGVKSLEGLCSKDKFASACTQLGLLYRNGSAGLTADPQKAADLYAKGCDLKDEEGCIGAYEIYAYGYINSTYDYKKATPFLETACNKLKSGLACRREAQLYDWGGGDIPSDKDKASKLYAQSFTMLQKDCDGGDGQSCSELGTMYRDGSGTSTDVKKAEDLFDKGCKNGAGLACYYQAGLYDPEAYYSYVQGRDALVDSTYAKSYALYDKACEKYDEFNSCYTAGKWLIDGKVKGDVRTVEKLAKRVCDQSPYSCNLYALLKDEGKLVAQDQAGALTLYEKACGASNSSACTTAADKYYSSYQYAKALTMYEKACELWDAASCTRAASWYWYGDPSDGIPQDQARAFTLYDEGCNRGDMSGCLSAAQLLVDGTDGTNNKNPAGAVNYYNYACGYGYGSACTALGDLYAAGSVTGTVDKVDAVTQYNSACFAYGTYDPYGCQKLVPLLKDGKDGVTKDLVTAGRAEAVLCKGGWSTDDCTQADSLMRQGNADQWTRDQAVYDIQSGCDIGMSTACVGLALMYRDGSFLVSKNPTEGFNRLQSACATGYSSEACYHLGECFEKGLGTAKDKDQARLNYQSACNAYITDACVAVARVAGDPDDFARLCDGQMAAGCVGAGAAYFGGVGVAWDVGKAYGYYEKGCTLATPPATDTGGTYGGYGGYDAYGYGYGAPWVADPAAAQSCASLAEMLEFGIGKDADAKKAYTLFQQSCDQGYTPACGEAARFLEKGEGGAAVDLDKADKQYASACDADSAEACRWYADFLASSKKGTPQKIAQLKQKAFSLAKDHAEASPYGMWLLGTFHRDGIATLKDPDKAVKLFVQACEANYPMGCLDAGRMYLAEPGSEGITPDKQVAALNLDKACAANVAEACALADKARGAGPNPITKTQKGCCDTGQGGFGAIVPGLIVLLLLYKRRKSGHIIQHHG